MLGRLLAEIPPPPAGLGLREVIEHLACGLRAVGARHPSALPLLFTRPAVSPAAMGIVDVVYQALLAAGVPAAAVPRLERMLSTFVIGHVSSEVNGRFGGGSLDPHARRAQLPPHQLPGHQAIAEHLDAPVDWDQEFRTDLRDLCELMERLGGPARPTT